MPVIRLVLIRHGQSLATTQGIAGGQRGCRGLSELGRRQVQALAQRLETTGEAAGADVLLSSTLPRAVETAEGISAALGGLAVQQDRGLCEMDPGEGDGLTWSEWEARYGTFDLGAEPYRPLAPGGESWAGFGLRVGETLSRIVAGHPNATVVACCHGGVIEHAFMHALGLVGEAPGRRLSTAPNASLNEWHVDEGIDGQRWRLMRFGDAAHVSRLSE